VAVAAFRNEFKSKVNTMKSTYVSHIMPRSLTACVMVTLLTCGGCANAASMLRIACDDDATGSQVTINGKFKGDCPLDVKVDAGSVSIVATKPFGQFKFQRFSTQFTIGDGIAKRVDVALGSPEWTPEGQKLENERVRRLESEAFNEALKEGGTLSLRKFLKRYPNSSYTSDANREIAKRESTLPPISPRPTMTWNPTEEMWDFLETSPFYRTFPKTRSITISYDETFTIDGQEFPQGNFRYEIAPLGDHCSTIRTQTPSLVSDTVTCAGVVLSSTMTIGQRRIESRILKLSADATCRFPLEVGNKCVDASEFSSSYPPKGTTSITKSCEVIERTLAASYLPGVAGNALVLNCLVKSVIYENQKATFENSREFTDLFFEDYGFSTASIGLINRRGASSFAKPITSGSFSIPPKGEGRITNLVIR
jgi:hypothetical protein